MDTTLISEFDPYPDLEIPYMSGETPRQFIRRDGYSTSYNHDTRCPNWVAWVLKSEHVDTAKCKVCYNRDGVPFLDEEGKAYGIEKYSKDLQYNHYIEDLSVPAPRQTHNDWTFLPDSLSRGHMCPAADCNWNPAAQNQASLLSNICPQTKVLNNGSWRKLEEKCRTNAIYFGRIFIVCGPVFNNGVVTKTMGDNKIAIPDKFFKVVLCMEGLPKAIGFVYENTNDSHNMQDAVRTLDEVEELTGFDFFPQLPDDIETEVESHSNLNEWR